MLLLTMKIAQSLFMVHIQNNKGNVMKKYKKKTVLRNELSHITTLQEEGMNWNGITAYLNSKYETDEFEAGYCRMIVCVLRKEAKE